MTQEEKDLLLKDLCARLPYNICVLHRGEVNQICNISPDGKFQNYNYNAWFDIEDIKPYLRLLSSMTNEERKEFDKLINLVEERCINGYGKGGYSLAFTELNDWLNEHHFDYRGLIEKGLALEAPKDMYNI